MELKCEIINLLLLCLNSLLHLLTSIFISNQITDAYTETLHDEIALHHILKAVHEVHCLLGTIVIISYMYNALT